jgi:formate C-acetyltransferase
MSGGRYLEKMARLRARKSEETKAKLDKLGVRDEDDYGIILPPDDFNPELPYVDADGSFSGAFKWGRNFRYLMENHPCAVDPDNAIAGRWMFMMSRLRKGYKLSRSNFAFDYSHLEPLQQKYDITPGIGKDAHFAPDYTIGLELGWGGLKSKVEAALVKYSDDCEARELLEAELDAIIGVQTWISNLASACKAKGLEDLAFICGKLVEGKPSTLHEACQWIAIFNMASRTYNRDGAGGQLDELLRPYYERDKASGLIDDEDAEFYVFCLLLNDPHYYQLGGPSEDGRDQTSRMSYIILEAAAKLKSSCNLTVRVWDGMDRGLYRRAVEILLENRLGYPRFSGDKALVEGFMRNGYDISLARRRIATGCNWMSLPGLEYTLNDVVKINVAKVFEVAFAEVSRNPDPSVLKLEEAYVKHFCEAVKVTAEGIDFHLSHQYLNEPELMLNLLSHGPIEKGRDMAHGGATFYNMAIDGAGLAVVADSFAALEQRVEDEKSLSWSDVARACESDFNGAEGERIRALLSSSDRYGHGGSRGDKWAQRLTEILVDSIANRTTPQGFKLIPGWFSWADTIRFGKSVGATPNGRRSFQPISHGANPLPGFRRDGALTAMACAVASVQPGYGNTAPWQLEVDIGFADDEGAVEKLMALMDGHFALGGTLININIVDAKTILDAHKHPERYPDLIVRVTGFSAYFTSLSPDFRKLVVERILKEAI